MTSRKVKAQASVWLARLKADDATPADRMACEAWLAQSEHHRQALAEATEVWDSMGGLVGRVAVPKREARSLALDRRAAIFAGAAGAGGLIVWGLSAPRTYATSVGQVRTVGLSDGSHATLDTDSEIREGFGRGARRLDLMRGRVALSIVPDPNRPFLVADGPRRVLALGPSLEVARRGAEFSVVSLSGPVFVEAPGAQTVRLDTGERLREAPDTPGRTDRPPLQAALAWRTGQLVFEDEPLSSAAAEVNRYNRRPIIVDVPGASNFRVSGTYSARESDAFARAVAALFDLRVREERDQVVLESASST